MSIFDKIMFLFKRNSKKEKANQLYWQIVALSRNPVLFKEFKIADTIDGRFDSLMLHIFLIIERLKAIGETELSELILNLMIKDVDRSYRESGVGDPSIARKMRKVGEAYMGRITAYQNAGDNPDLLSKALWRNVYREQNISDEYITLLTHYVLNYKQLLGGFTLSMPIPKMTLQTSDTL